MNNICIVGDVFVDVTLKKDETPLKMRLGGIIHAARALWAMNIPYSIGYFAPEYLDSHISEFLSHFNCTSILKLGKVSNCPNIMLIEEVKEMGDQGYEFLLRNNIDIEYNILEMQRLKKFENIFFISGSYDLFKICKLLPKGCKKHLDLANNACDYSITEGQIFWETLFISTSSKAFMDFYLKKPFEIISFFSIFKGITRRLVFKENRGGSRAIDFTSKEIFSIPSQTQKIVHSVGVGDVFDVSYISLSGKYSMVDALYYSSWIACEYAKTTFPDDFRKMTSRALKIESSELIALHGCSLSWEERENCHIYIAGPDFDHINTSKIDLVEKNLLYHNFVPHRPVKENGQMEIDACKDRKQQLYANDMLLLNKCNLLIAVLLYNDPGTLIEIGLAAARNIPTLVYDPYRIAKNCMLTELPNLVSSDLDEIISEVFCIYGKLKQQ